MGEKPVIADLFARMPQQRMQQTAFRAPPQSQQQAAPAAQQPQQQPSQQDTILALLGLLGGANPLDALLASQGYDPRSRSQSLAMFSPSAGSSFDAGGALSGLSQKFGALPGMGDLLGSIQTIAGPGGTFIAPNFQFDPTALASTKASLFASLL